MRVNKAVRQLLGVVKCDRLGRDPFLSCRGREPGGGLGRFWEGQHEAGHSVQVALGREHEYSPGGGLGSTRLGTRNFDAASGREGSECSLQTELLSPYAIRLLGCCAGVEGWGWGCGGLGGGWLEQIVATDLEQLMPS